MEDLGPVAAGPLSFLQRRNPISLVRHYVTMEVQMLLRAMILACCMVLAIQIAASAAPADSCKNLIQQFKSAADRANREVSSALVNLREAASQVPNDKERIALIAQSCVASAEAVGVLKSYRIVVDACISDRDPARSDFLDDIDRSISKLRQALDRACR
jgi:hypothetical protein